MDFGWAHVKYSGDTVAALRLEKTIHFPYQDLQNMVFQGQARLNMEDRGPRIQAQKP
jgi:hypothetical protein